MSPVNPDVEARLKAAAKPARPVSAQDPAARAAKAAAAEHSAHTRRRIQLAADRAARARARAMPRWAVQLARAGRYVTPVLVLFGLIGMAMQTGWVGQQFAAAGEELIQLSGHAGLRIEEIRYEGLNQTSQADVHTYLRVQEQDPILALNPADATARLQALPWVQSAVVERQLPNRVAVRLVERRPMARWQESGVLQLVDEDGTVLSQQIPERFQGLPLLIGDDAPKSAKPFLDTLKAHPTVMERVKAVTLISGRRWRLRLDRGTDVELPESGLEAALKRLEDEQKSSGIMDRGIATIDLRVAGKPAVELTPEAQKQRDDETKPAGKTRDRRI